MTPTPFHPTILTTYWAEPNRSATPRSLGVLTTVNLSDAALLAGKILIVDDEDDVIDTLRAALAERGFDNVLSVTDPTAAAGVYDEFRPHIETISISRS